MRAVAPLRSLASVALFLAVGLSACAGPAVVNRPAPPEQPVERPRPAEEPPAHPAYETFDPAGYDAEPVAAPVRPAGPVQHDVPPELMAGRIELPVEAPPPERPLQPVRHRVQGFRIQVFSDEDRRTAERVREEAAAWGRSALQQPDALMLFEAYVDFQQPYYRVQLGDYEFRDEAQEALATVRRRYSGAFIAPATVTVVVME